ncbi:1138_t:CDS:1, partial [Gigaspora margarita]
MSDITEISGSSGKNNIQNGNPAISGENSTPNGNSEISLELKKFLNGLSRNQKKFYDSSGDKINFLKAIQEERKKW